MKRQLLNVNCLKILLLFFLIQEIIVLSANSSEVDHVYFEEDFFKRSLVGYVDDGIDVDPAHGLEVVFSSVISKIEKNSDGGISYYLGLPENLFSSAYLDVGGRAEENRYLEVKWKVGAIWNRDGVECFPVRYFLNNLIDLGWRRYGQISRNGHHDYMMRKNDKEVRFEYSYRGEGECLSGVYVFIYNVK